ncbi:MAG TPA: hypothetical protein VGH81_10845 [Rudaea sp.]|jgi:hypothetical protein
MKSLKTLMLAVAGLAGLGMVSAAFGQACSATNLTAWAGGTSALSGGTVNVVAGGLDGSACAMSTVLGTSSASQATVADTSPNNEPRYRFQFLLNSDGLSALSATDGVVIFAASGATTVNGRRGIIQVALVPASGGNKRLSFNYSCNNGTTFRCSANTGTNNLVAGVNRIEFDVQMATSGANGSIRYWLNAAAGTTEPAVTGQITGIDNSAWVGTKIVALGLGSPVPSYSSAHHGQAVLFDAFDSRRQTYIGY